MKQVLIAKSILQKMIAHALQEAPNECCGVIGGTGNRLETWYPMRNDQSSPTRYFGNPPDLFSAVKSMRNQGEEMTGIYHSHPTSPAYPSTTDIEENGYPGLYYFIISLAGEEPDVQCFHILEEGTVILFEVVPG